MKERDSYKHWIETVFISFLCTLILSASASSPWEGYILPSFAETNTNITAYVGSTVLLPCSINNLGTKKVIWKRVNQKHALTIDDFVFTSDSRYYIDHTDHGGDWNLVIKDVTKDHAGMYECQISTKEDLSHQIRLNVIDRPPIDKSKAIHISGPNFTEKGEKIQISCNASIDSMTPDQVDWFRDGLKLKSDSETGLSITTNRHRETKTLYSVLEIQKSKMTDAGTYICRSSKKDVVSHHVVVLNADSSHEKRGFQDKSKLEKSSHVEHPGTSASTVNKSVHYFLSLCLLVLRTLSAFNR